MCFQTDSSPPVAPVKGASVDTARLVLTAADGNRFRAFEAVGTGDGPAVLVLPDVRGLYSFYEDLAVRFAERGMRALAIDYFGRTAGLAERAEDFDYMPHVHQTTFAGVSTDAAAGIAHLREGIGAGAVFTVGFCFGGGNSWHMSANDIGLAGAIGFYGHPNRVFPEGATPLIDRVDDFAAPLLCLMGGEDPGIPVAEVETFRDRLVAAGKPHDIVIYEGAPHSFFDRKYEDYAEESADAWERVLTFIADKS